LLNLLADIKTGSKLREGYTYHTRGISLHVIPLSPLTPAMVLFDAAGSNTGVDCKTVHISYFPSYNQSFGSFCIVDID
jgi:hypothetical protein